MNDRAGVAGRIEATLCAPIALEPAVVEAVRSRLCALTSREVNLVSRVDMTIEGAIIEVGRATRLEFGLDSALRALERDIGRALSSATPSEGAHAVERAVFETVDRGLSGRFGEVRESGLWRLLKRMKGSVVQLESRIPLDPGLVDQVGRRLTTVAGREISVDARVEPGLGTHAVLRFGPETSVDLDLRERLLEQLQDALARRDKARLRTLESTTEYLARVIKRTRPVLRVSDVSGKGSVEQVGDGVALVRGLRRVGSQEVVRFDTGPYGVAFNLLEDSVGVIMLGAEELVGVGTGVERTGRLLQVPTGEALHGRIVNALGEPVDGKGPVPLENLRPVERVAPGVVRRHPVTEPLHTGVKILDALVPLGRGQRELILGDRKIGKTTIALDTILSQKDSDVVCVYAAIGQKASSVAGVVDVLREHGALDYTVVVVAFSNEQPAFRYLVPYTACAIAEQVMDSGGHALVVYDDLSKHAVTYREMSALLKRPIGREAYPGDVFYIHSRLLERAARMRDDLGGGSMTALPIVETLAGDISAFIPTNVISICDGQIMLDAGLFNEGFRPPMDAGLSVSRVGGMAQTSAMKRVAGRLRIDLAQYEEMAQFVKFGAEVDQTTLDQLRRGEREREVLKQDQHVPLPLEKQVAVLYGVTNGYADRIPVEHMRRFEEGLLEFLDTRHPALLAAIAETKRLEPATEEMLARAAETFAREFADRVAAAGATA